MLFMHMFKYIFISSVIINFTLTTARQCHINSGYLLYVCQSSLMHTINLINFYNVNEHREYVDIGNLQNFFIFKSLAVCHFHRVLQSSLWLHRCYKRAEIETRNFKGNRLLAHLYPVEEPSLHCLFIQLMFLSHHPFAPPSLPLFPRLSFPPSCSMFLQTCVFVTLCWSSPCQYGPCRRCWLTLDKTTKG